MKINLPSKKNIASFDVDPQKTFSYFCPRELPIKNSEKIVPSLNFNATLSSKRIASKDAHNENAIWIPKKNKDLLKSTNFFNADTYWPKHAIVGTKGFNFFDGLPNPLEYDFFVWKGIEVNLHPYGACFHDMNEKLSTGIIEYLRQNKISLVIIGGICLEYCVKYTSIQLKKNGFEIIINLSSCIAMDEKNIKKIKKEMKKINIIVVDNLKKSL